MKLQVYGSKNVGQAGSRSEFRGLFANSSTWSTTMSTTAHPPVHNRIPFPDLHHQNNNGHGPAMTNSKATSLPEAGRICDSARVWSIPQDQGAGHAGHYCLFAPETEKDVHIGQSG